MSDRTETMLIKSANGPVRINASDFDKDKHEVYSDTSKQAKDNTAAETNAAASLAPGVVAAPAPSAVGPNPVAPQNPSAEAPKLMKEGNRYFIVNSQGEKLVADGIDKKGYKTEGEAWEAVIGLQRAAVDPANPNAPELPVEG